jgi:PAS domain S-box-containing protein
LSITRQTDGCFLKLNSAAVEFYDMPEDSLLSGLGLNDVYAERRAELSEMNAEWQGKGHLDRYEIETCRLGRREQRWCLVSTSSIDYRGEPANIGSFIDVTERKRAERELAEQKTLLDVVFENMDQGVVMYDRDLIVTTFNEQARRYFRLPEDVLFTGALFYDINIYARSRGDPGTGETKRQTEERWEDLKNGRPHSLEYVHSDGAVIEIRRCSAPGGGFVVTQTDITERKRPEKAIGEKNQMLESLSNQLSKYLSPQVYASIFSGDQSVEIASKRKKLTIFFSDIADFTGTTESLESEELTNLLNNYLTEMSKIALDHGATIDKYVGDSIIAFFGDPETLGVKEDARSCVNMAIAMQRRMRELRFEWLNMGLERPFQQRIGINTGFCTVGNFGSADRMDYTIIGNEVNLAARLESRAEVGGILLAHETHSLVKDTVMAKEGDTLTVKGFAKPVRTYSVQGLYDDLVEQGRIIRKEQEGLALVIDRNKLTKKGKAEAIIALEEAVAQLKV